MNKPLVHIYWPVDETGNSHSRLEKHGLKLLITDQGRENGIEKTKKTRQKIDPRAICAAGIASQSLSVDEESISAAKSLRLIAKYTVGYDNVNVEAASKNGVLVVHSPTESNWGGVAEGTMAYMLTLLKKVREKDQHVKNGGWRHPNLWGTYLGARQIDNFDGITIGIVGLGRIGCRFASLLAPWRVKLIAFDPFVDENKFALHNVQPVDLDTLLKTSDVVSIHCNLNEVTEGLIGEKQLKLMKKTSILVNTARGPIVNIDALFHALDKDLISGAALDVLPEEPPKPQEPILGLGDKILLSPHMITSNKGLGLDMAIPWVEEAILCAIRGKVPRHVVNPEIIPEWEERVGKKSLI